MLSSVIAFSRETVAALRTVLVQQQNIATFQVNRVSGSQASNCNSCQRLVSYFVIRTLNTYDQHPQR